MKIASVSILWIVFVFSIHVATGAPERVARTQPTVPENYSEIPFMESAPEPEPTAEESQRGYLLFHRPITEPVMANTRPLAGERLSGGLGVFATPGEWKPVTLGVYPLRDLKNFVVKVSDLSGAAGEIGAGQLTVRLQTYWNVGYPRYTSRETYRRVPELLERVDSHSSPARECQRWWIQIHVPEAAKAGVYKGTVTVGDDAEGSEVTIPLSLRVLGFPLQSDPAKNYSAYYRTRDRRVFEDRDEAFYQKASANDFRAMREYGLDMFPTIHLGADRKITKILLQHEEELERMKSFGLGGRVPVLGDSAIARIYYATTPGGKRENHWKISKMPPPEFYQKVTELFRAFVKDAEARGLPPMICCPLDEVAASNKEFGIKVFEAVRASGMPTYITKLPTAVDARDYAPHVDVWCSQPYAIPYEKIVAQKRHEYWSYPNHNAGESKNRRTMCKGGRMTYGFGFWRSGYTTLIPWHWSWVMKPDVFDYLRSTQSGCGMRIDEDGEIIPAIYWECFREGRDDARYLYTLQQAVFEREGSDDAQCVKKVAAAKALLQETWDSIAVQERYLSEGMWPSKEFDNRRWLLATATGELLAFPAVREGSAPSVLVGKIGTSAAAGSDGAIAGAIAQGIVIARDIGGDFSKWTNVTSEGSKEVTAAAAIKEGAAPGMRWRVKVDHLKSDSKHLLGWPRVIRKFGKGELDLSRYDFIEVMVRVDSDRDEVADDITKFGLNIINYEGLGRLYKISRDLGDAQQVWIPLRFPIKEMVASAAQGDAPWARIKALQLFIAESDYDHGTAITFDIGSAKLLAFAKPLISRVEAPRYVALPSAGLLVDVDVIGRGSVTPGSHSVAVQLVDGKGVNVSEARQDLAVLDRFLLDTSSLALGRHTLTVQVTDVAGELCSESTKTVDVLAGPFFGE